MNTPVYKSSGAFSDKSPGLQLIWDSTSLGLFKTCPRKYYYSMIEGWEPRAGAIHLRFGIILHKALELWEKQDDIAAIAYALLASSDIVCPRCSTRRAVTEAESLDPEKLFAGLHCDGCDEEIYPQFVPMDPCGTTKSRFNLIRTIVWYMDSPDAATTIRLDDGTPALELSFLFDSGITSRTGESFLFSGHLDRVAEYAGELWTLDRKTTGSTIGSNFFEKFSPDNQMSLYTLAGKVVTHRKISGVIVDGMQIAQGFTRFARGFVSRTPAQIEEWRGDALEWIDAAETAAERQSWPMNDTACNLYGGCKFRGICSKDPSVRQTFLQSNFEQRLWDPSVRR